MSKNAIWAAAQNPLAATSNFASSNVLVVLWSNCSPVSFCNVGPVQTSRHISFRYLAVMFLGLLWRSVMKDPFLHVRACPMLKLLPHAHVLGVQDGGHQYLMLTRSQNSCLLSIYPSSSIGRVIRHVEAPCSVLMLFSLRCWPVSLDLILTLYYLILTCINMFSLIVLLCFPFDFLLDVVYSFFFNFVCSFLTCC